MAGNNNDIQAQINALKAVNPNDPQIPVLQAQRDDKLRSIYGNDYQAALNNMSPSDPLYADLTRLRNEKIASAAPAPPTTAPTVTPVVSATQANDSMNTLNDAINKILAQSNTNQQNYSNMVNNQVAAVNRIVSPENYNTILNTILQSYQPMMDAQKQQAAEQLTEADRKSNIDVEKRGLFNSGVGSVLQQQNQRNSDNDLAAALAALQKEAAGNANNAVGQQLQAANITGSMLSDAQKSSNDALTQSLNAALGVNSAQNKTWETTLDSQKVSNDYDIAMKNIDNDKTKIGIEKDKLKLDTLNTALEQGKFDESIRQFNEEMALKKQLRVDDITKFNKQVSLQAADSKASLINAQANMLRAQVENKQFLSDQEMLDYQKSMDVYGKLQEGYKFVASMKDNIMNGTMPKEDAIALIKPYEQLDRMYPGIYKEMMDTVKTYYDQKDQDDTIKYEDNKSLAKSAVPNAAPGATPQPTYSSTPKAYSTPSPYYTPAPARR